MDAGAHEVFWLTCRESDVPEEDLWLSETEREVLARFRFLRRRSEWRLGRWTAKRLLSAMLLPGVDPVQIEIASAPDGSPYVTCSRLAEPVTLSISHRAGMAFCTANRGERPLGCDLELIEFRSDAFINDYFTAEERRWVEATGPAYRSVAANLVWAAKESTLKALKSGLTVDTRSVRVRVETFEPEKNGWMSLSVTSVSEQRVFRGWWDRSQDFVRVMVSEGGIPEPVHAGR